MAVARDDALISGNEVESLDIGTHVNDMALVRTERPPNAKDMTATGCRASGAVAA